MRRRLAILLVFFVARAWGQGGRFSDVKGWTGVIRAYAEVKGSATIGKMSQSYETVRRAEARVTLDRWDPSTNSWVGAIEGTASLLDKLVTTSNNSVHLRQMEGQAALALDPYGKKRQFYLSIDSKGRFLLSTNSSSIQGRDKSIADGQLIYDIEYTMPWFPPTSHLPQPFPAEGNTLKGTMTSVINAPYVLLDNRPVELKWHVEWDLKATGAQELEVVIEPSDTYAKWFPVASRDETKPGNGISAKAILRAKDGSLVNTKADKFVWTLAASREPGVSMNYPTMSLGAPPESGWDLRFNKALNSGLKVSDLEAETIERGLSESKVVVSSHDHGAWGVLRVKAHLADGRVLTGVYKGEPELRLPKRAKNSLIADYFKELVNYYGPDDADDDSLPEGDGHGGDGLTFYEEYRGFYEGGKHISTDPRKKDLFIRDDVGGRTKPGIALFAKLTGLAVHHKLTPEELLMFPERHYINFNGRESPHRVDQHGIVIVETDRIKEGALAWSNQYKWTIGTPRHVDLIGISTTPGEGRGIGAISYYDKIIAHELLHCVGVHHHGDTDYRMDLALKYREETGAVEAWDPHGQSYMKLLDEANGEDLAPRYYRAFRNLAEELGSLTAFDAALKSPEGWTAFDFIVGKAGGQHSGADECIMRYEFATASEHVQHASTYYEFHTQTRGASLCDSPDGTGNNARDRRPQSRHGDASPKRGGCRRMICVNDAMDHEDR